MYALIAVRQRAACIRVLTLCANCMCMLVSDARDPQVGLMVIPDNGVLDLHFTAHASVIVVFI